MNLKVEWYHYVIFIIVFIAVWIHEDRRSKKLWKKHDEMMNEVHKK